MRRRLALLTVLATVALGSTVPVSSADPVPVRTLSISGTAAAMYPEFSPDIERYAVTTDATTAGALTVSGSTSDPDGQVWVNGVLASGPTPVSGLAAGDEVSVIIEDAGGRTPYSVIYLPAGFPRLNVTTHQAGLAEGYIGLTMGTFEQNALQPYDAIIDRNGVPIWAIPSTSADLDLRQQPTGEITISRYTNVPGRTGHSLVTLDDQLLEATRQDVAAPLTNTDAHDSIKMLDGSTIFTGYEYDAERDLTDATIQKVDAEGNETFRWTSAALETETTAPAQSLGASGDYAHINSVVSVADGDVIASFRHFSAVLRIATVAHDGYQPGDIIWKLGGRDSDFTFVDDPFSGPCAQHTASELANGNIVIYDNGSNGLCVNPADPTGPTIDRGQTRITEYALDTTAHTATLVWSYAPADTYAWFAGSARRLSNGNTLIGWADARANLATEVSSDKEILWEVNTLPAAAGHRNYITYRAELITSLSDKIKPVATQTGPADSATLAQGTVVNAAASCADRGGSNLATCTTTGITDGHLDTSVLGTHSWTTTAVDVAGNTTTATRNYVVRSAVRRPDGLIRRAEVATWKGNDIYGPATNQTVAQRARRGTAVTSYWRVQNDGERADVFTLTGTATSYGYAVRYWSNGVDVTRAIVAGTFRTTSLAPGATKQIRVVITPKRVRGAASAKTFTLRAASGAAIDRVAVKVTAR